MNWFTIIFNWLLKYQLTNFIFTSDNIRRTFFVKVGTVKIFNDISTQFFSLGVATINHYQKFYIMNANLDRNTKHRGVRLRYLSLLTRIEMSVGSVWLLNIQGVSICDKMKLRWVISITKFSKPLRMMSPLKVCHWNWDFIFLSNFSKAWNFKFANLQAFIKN